MRTGAAPCSSVKASWERKASVTARSEMRSSSTWSVLTPTTTRPPLSRATSADRAMSSRVAAASRPMFRWAVSIASATPRPHPYTERRKSRVASQSMSAGWPGVLSPATRGTTCAAAYATRERSAAVGRV